MALPFHVGRVSVKRRLCLLRSIYPALRVVLLSAIMAEFGYPMNRTIQRLLLLFPFFLILVLTNWFMDPAHLRAPDAYEKGIAKMLAQGKAVTNVINDDASAILEYSIHAQKSAPDVLLLGTSKSKGINSDFFPGQTFFNAALSGSGLDDQLVIYNMYERRGFSPKEVVFEVNPWLLMGGRTSQVARFKVQGAQLTAALLRGESPKGPARTEPNSTSTSLTKMITPDYFQTSSLALVNKLFRGNDGSAREYYEGDTPSGTTYFPDGSILVPPYMIANLGSEQPEAYALKYGWDPPGGIPRQIDPLQQKIFEAFIQHLLNSGVKVTFYIPPYHPTSYRLMMDSPNRFVADIQNYFVDFARAHDIEVIGSYNPADIGITDADFYDPTHITTESIWRVFEGSR